MTNKQEKPLIKIRGIITILAIIILFYSLYLNGKVKGEINSLEAEKKDFATTKSFVTIWSCMDGCYNMLIVEYGKENLDYWNDTQYYKHLECSELCYEQYPLIREDE